MNDEKPPCDFSKRTKKVNPVAQTVSDVFWASGDHPMVAFGSRSQLAAATRRPPQDDENDGIA